MSTRTDFYVNGNVEIGEWTSLKERKQPKVFPSKSSVKSEKSSRPKTKEA